jgi:DNA-binding transcriptional LysR family regulator
LNALRAFDAVVRRGSILQAAEELGVVRGAVRRQLAVLEAHVGVPLFERDGRRLIPTKKGKLFADAVGTAFGILARASAELSAGERRTIHLGVPSAFAVWWLMPRIADLQATLPDVDIDVIPMPVVEPLPRRPDLDAVIMGGEYRPAPEIVAIRFMEDEFGPVAVPAIAVGLGPTVHPNPGKDMAVLANAVVLSSRAAPQLWDDWLVESGRKPIHFARRREFEDLLLTLAAARSGLGIAIAPRAAIGEDLKRGILAAPYGFIGRPAGYSLSIRGVDAEDSALAGLANWLVGAGQG